MSKKNEFTKARFKMEKLLQDLESQVSCSICFEFPRTPQILPCFHALCLQCLNRIAVHHACDGEFERPSQQPTLGALTFLRSFVAGKANSSAVRQPLASLVRFTVVKSQAMLKSVPASWGGRSYFRRNFISSASF